MVDVAVREAQQRNATMGTCRRRSAIHERVDDEAHALVAQGEPGLDGRLAGDRRRHAVQSLERRRAILGGRELAHELGGIRPANARWNRADREGSWTELLDVEAEPRE